jgi:hypothetical protein
MMRLKHSKLTIIQTNRLCEHFVAGTPARTAAELIGVNKNTAVLFYHRLTARYVRMRACMLDHRAAILSRSATRIRKLAYNETLAEEKAALEKRMRARRALWATVEDRIQTIKGLSKVALNDEPDPGIQQRHITMIDRQCDALSNDYAALFNMLIRLAAKE